MESMTVLMAKRRRSDIHAGAQVNPSASRSAAAARPGLLQAPAADLLVVTRQQDLRHGPAAELSGPRVVRVLGKAFERVAEGLLHGRAGVPERAGKPAQH